MQSTKYRRTNWKTQIDLYVRIWLVPYKRLDLFIHSFSSYSLILHCSKLFTIKLLMCIYILYMNEMNIAIITKQREKCIESDLEWDIYNKKEPTCKEHIVRIICNAYGNSWTKDFQWVFAPFHWFSFFFSFDCFSISFFSDTDMCVFRMILFIY